MSTEEKTKSDVELEIERAQAWGDDIQELFLTLGFDCISVAVFIHFVREEASGQFTDVLMVVAAACLGYLVHWQVEQKVLKHDREFISKRFLSVICIALIAYLSLPH